MAKDIKVIYYVDSDDNTKGTLCAIPSEWDMRTEGIINFIADEILSVFRDICHLKKNDAIELATTIAHHNYAASCEYEFGVEEIPLFETC